MGAGFASLGFWQWGRATQKQDWLDAYTAALNAPAIDLKQALPELPLAMPVRVEGSLHWLDQSLLFLDGQQREGQVGVRVYSLVRANEGAPALLVELGWLPFEAARGLPSLHRPTNIAQTQGLLLPWPSQGLRLAENQWGNPTQPQLLAYLDRNEIERATGLRLYDGVLRPDPDVELGAQRDAVALPNTLPPAQHRGYAVQWWALSLTTVVAFLILFWRRRTK